MLMGFVLSPVFSQVLYSSTEINGDSYNPGNGKLGTPKIMLDDVLIPSAQVAGTDSISITKLKFGIVRFGSAPASTISFYYSILDDTATLFRNAIKTPPVLLGTFNFLANDTVTKAFIISLGDSVNALFKVKTDTGNVFAGYQTIFLGMSFSGDPDPGGLNDWLITTPGLLQSNNQNVWWEYDADAAPLSRAAYSFGVPPAPPGTFYMQVFGKGLKILPVTMSQFSARRASAVNVLNWTTEQEINASYFVIERSTDGSNYSSIGKVNAAGNSSTTRNYSFTDMHPAKGNNYYRIRTVDIDNSAKLSVTRQIRNEGIADISVYPNPVTDLITVAVNADKATEGQMTITDMSGKTVYTRSVKLSQGNTMLPIPATNIAAGNYILKIQLEDDVIVKQFIKQ